MECNICGTETNLVLHHESYYPEKTFWLCRSCHGKLHGHNKIRPQSYIPQKMAVINPKIPEELKKRLVKYTKENDITIKQATIKLLDENLPTYTE